jgi:hypothetical protein
MSEAKDLIDCIKIYSYILHLKNNAHHLFYYALHGAISLLLAIYVPNFAIHFFLKIIQQGRPLLCYYINNQKAETEVLYKDRPKGGQKK